MKAAIYARVSTDHQELDTQIAQLQEFCQYRGYDVAHIYSDIASGSKESRPGLDQLMKQVFIGGIDLVVVWRLDRLGRSLKHLLSVTHQLETRKVDFISVTQQFDTTTPSGKLLFSILGAMAEFERQLISERTKDGLKKAKNVGKRGKDKNPRKKGGYYLRYKKQPVVS